jgi:very-short-patch-repair endonuclease
MCQAVISKFQKVHGNKFDYSKVLYSTAKTKVIVTCNEHGDFLITPNNHLSGYGCLKCSGRGFTKEENLSRFINNGHKIHNNKYDYSLVDISAKKLIIICPIHGEFTQTKIGHITNKSGCPLCGKDIAANKTQLGNSRFIEKANKTHNGQYSYNNVIYVNAHKKVNVTCSIHGDFSVTPVNHWSNGVGCPSCSNSNPSKGEVIVKNWLVKHNIHFEYQKTFNNLYYKSKKGRLKYDFFIPNQNLLIEFDGEYHFRPISFSKLISGVDQLALTQIRDNIKAEYAATNGFKLLRIRFNEDIISKLETAVMID